MKSFQAFILALALVASVASAGDPPRADYDSIAQRIAMTALGQNVAYDLLRELCTTVGGRVAGSPQAAEAVQWTKRTMERYGFANVHTEPVMVPRWVRGNVEDASYAVEGVPGRKLLEIATLGGSVGTLTGGVSGELVEVRSWEELKAVGPSLKGKIVFYNRPMDRSLLFTGWAYGRAVDQRSRGAIEAAKYGAAAAVVRSMTTRLDNVPHTGAMDYVDTIPKIPGIAVSTNDADQLAALLRAGKRVTLTLTLSCQTLPDVESANVVGDLIGSELPNEIVVIGGHLDSWDKGQGAHDDGAGCIHSIEAIRLLKELGLKPKRTIRAVMFMNEEHGLNGGKAYAERLRPGERHMAAIETDAGGFMPQGFGVSDSSAWVKLGGFASAFRQFGADHIVRGGGGADIGPLTRMGVPSIGLMVDGQRYFDYHHSANDVIENVNERELAYGAACVAILAYIIAQEGL